MVCRRHRDLRTILLYIAADSRGITQSRAEFRQIGRQQQNTEDRPVRLRCNAVSEAVEATEATEPVGEVGSDWLAPGSGVPGNDLDTSSCCKRPVCRRLLLMLELTSFRFLAELLVLMLELGRRGDKVSLGDPSSL